MPKDKGQEIQKLIQAMYKLSDDFNIFWKWEKFKISSILTRPWPGPMYSQ